MILRAHPAFPVLLPLLLLLLGVGANEVLGEDLLLEAAQSNEGNFAGLRGSAATTSLEDEVEAVAVDSLDDTDHKYDRNLFTQEEMEKLLELGGGGSDSDVPGTEGYLLPELEEGDEEDGRYLQQSSTVEPPPGGLTGYVQANVMLKKKVKPTIPNIGYLFTGYNIMQGNPIDSKTKIDPGFTVQIFRPSLDTYIKTPDGRYMQPGNTTILNCEGCDMSSTTEIMESSDQYKKSLETKVSAGVKIGVLSMVDVAFKSSAGWKETSDRLETKNEVTMETESSCCVYRAELSTYVLPKYAPNFVAALNQLSNKEAELVGSNNTNITVDDFDYMLEDFVEEFGTHYVKKMDMGSLYGRQSFMSKETKKTLESRGIDISLSASLGVTAGGVNVSVSSEFSLAKQSSIDRFFLEQTSKTSMYTRGSKPPGDGKADSWLASTKTNPAPIKLELERIDTLPGYSPLVRNILKGYLDKYCENMKRQHLFMGTCDANAGAKKSGPFDAHVSTTNMRQQSHLKTHHFHELALSNEWGSEKSYIPESQTVITGFGVKKYSDGWANHLKRRWEERSMYGVNTMKLSGKRDGLDKIEFEDTDFNEKYATIEKVCPKGYAIGSLTNNWHSRGGHAWKTGDWAWKLGCAKFKGVLISDRAVKTSGTAQDRYETMTQEWSPGFGNQDFHPWDFQCPPRHVLIGIRSVYRNENEKNGFHYQREWYFRCGYMHDEGTEAGTSLTSYVNDAGKEFYYVAATNALPVGFYSEVDSQQTFRRFKMVEKSLGKHRDAFAMGSVKSSHMDIVDGKFSKTCEMGNVLVGFWLSEVEPKQLYGVSCSPGTNIRLIDESRWSNESTLNDSFTFQCPPGYALIGLELGELTETTSDRAWKIQCQEYEFYG